MKKHNPAAFLPLDDPEIAAAIEHAVEPYKAIYTPAMIERARRDLRALLTAHPYTVALARAVHPRSEKAISVEEQIDDGEPVSSGHREEPARSSGGGAGRRGPR